MRSLRSTRSLISSARAGAVGALLVTTSLVVSLAPATAAPPTTTATTTSERLPGSVVPRLSWTSCGAGLEAFQCATAEVPTDYNQPSGAKTRIAVTRLPATDPARRIGTLFVNPGGPGGSGVSFVQQLGEVAYSADVRARFDLLGFDPRGVARSDPATCYPTAEQENAALAGTLVFPRTSAEERRFARDFRALALSCATTSPTRLRHISTANVARDLDLLRRAVGDPELNYVGYSYGTFLGATYAR